MTDPHELDDLTKEIRKIIQDNSKFLDRIMDDEFEPEEGDEESVEEIEL